MKKFALLIFTASLFISFSAVSAASIKGRWKTIDDETGKAKSIVNIWVYKGKAYGKIIRLFRGPGEEKNPKCTECKGRLNGKPIKGMTIMWGLKKDGDEWEDGSILDPANGKVYDCKIWTEGSGKLKVRGYLGPFYRTQTWYKQ